MAGLTRDAALDFLYARMNYERLSEMPYGEEAFRLDRMRELLVRLGHPESGLPIVHVAGTKGKGSTAAMIAAMFSAAGYHTGVFSSPHLDRIEERMAVDGQPCPTQEFVELIETVREVVEQMDADAAGRGLGEPGPTYFELTTALALLHFARRHVDVAVLEVGMGGRLDSTNVCMPRVAVITSISFDHTKQLGNTLAEIAREKAGIIKPGVPVVSGVLPSEPREVIEAVAAQTGSLLVQLGRDFEFTYEPARRLDEQDGFGQIDFRHSTPGHELRFDRVALGLHGSHQGANAAVAIAAVEEMVRQGWKVSEAAIRRGLAELSWPARVEVVSRQPTVVVDTAHNVASIEALIATLDESFSARRRTLVFATTQDKDVRGMLARLLPKFDRMVLTRYIKNPRGVAPEELMALASDLLGPAQAESLCSVALDPVASWNEATASAEPDDLICVTGSFFLAAEVRHIIQPTVDDPLATGTTVR